MEWCIICIQEGLQVQPLFWRKPSQLELLLNPLATEEEERVWKKDEEKHQKADKKQDNMSAIMCVEVANLTIIQPNKPTLIVRIVQSGKRESSHDGSKELSVREKEEGG